MGHQTLRTVFRRFGNNVRQIRRTAARDGLRQVTARQPLYRRRRRLCSLLELAAGAVAGVGEGFVVGCLIDLVVDVLIRDWLARVGFFPCGFRRRTVRVRHVLHLLVRRFGRLDFPLRARNIHHLRTNLPYLLRLLQPLLLFLFVKDWAQRLVGVFDVAAQLGHVLFLVVFVADDDDAVRDGRLRGRAVAAVAVYPDQQRAAHVTEELLADAAAGAHARTQMLDV